jgi:hypothetical protein
MADFDENIQYVTVAGRLSEFVKEYMPRGFYMKTIPSPFTITKENGDTVRGVVFEAQVYKRDEDGAEHFICNGFAEEREDASEINKFNYFEIAETSARGRALGALGIGLNGSIATKDEVQHRERLVGRANVRKKPSLERAGVSDKDTLERLKLEYEEADGFYVVSSARVTKKTAEVLKRYGFEKNADGLYAKKIEKEED